MKIAFLVILLAVLPCSALLAQVELIASRLCHDNNGRLMCFEDNDYVIKFEKRKFIGFSTKDSLVTYMEKEKAFAVKVFDSLNTNENKTVILKLSKTGPTIFYQNEKTQLNYIKGYWVLPNGDTTFGEHGFKNYFSCTLYYEVSPDHKITELRDLKFKAGDHSYNIEIYDFGKDG